MTDWLKAWLYRVLGRERYLRLVSRLFFLAYRSGWLRALPTFACHYYARRLIEPGDYVIDIGANLGYYTVLFAEWTGTEGKVFGVEPVPLYRSVLRRNTERFDHVEILPYALGRNSETVRMGIPGTNPHRHGLTRILRQEEGRDVAQTFEAEVRPPDVVFEGLARLDYVKCDVEGYEGEVLPAMETLIREHRPILQVEIAPENRPKIYHMLDRLGYEAYFVGEGRLIPIRGPEDDRARGDWIFRPQS